MESTLQDELGKGIQRKFMLRYCLTKSGWKQSGVCFAFELLSSVIGSKKIVQHITNHSKLAFFDQSVAKLFLNLRLYAFPLLCRALSWLHVFPRLVLVTCFPALSFFLRIVICSMLYFMCCRQSWKKCSITSFSLFQPPRKCTIYLDPGRRKGGFTGDPEVKSR